MKDLWINRLKKASRNLIDEDSPQWWDGFHNVVARNETSHDDDNPYVKYHEDAPYKAYRAGAKAGESLLRTLNRCKSASERSGVGSICWLGIP